MNRSNAARVVCPVCGERVRVTRDGSIVSHSRIYATVRIRRCSGSGQLSLTR